MSLAASLQTFRADSAAAAARNANYARPQNGVAPARTSTPKPATPTPSQGGAEKRSHDAAFNDGQTAASTGLELMTQVVFAIDYLREKRSAIPFDRLIEYLNIPNDAKANIPRIRTALRSNARVDFFPKGEDDRSKESYKYRPLHPVTNADELKHYVAGLANSAQGIPVEQLKDGFPDVIPSLNALEAEGMILLTRRKDRTPRVVYPNTPEWTLSIDQEFKDYWMKCKLPPQSNDVRKELETMGITPTSAVKVSERKAPSKKEKRRINRKSNKLTNSHMLPGLLKEYTTTRKS